METTYTRSPEGADSTRMTLRNRGGMKGIAPLLAPLAVRRATCKDLARLRTILERPAS